MLMLGAPVIKIELDEKQLMCAIEEALSRLTFWAGEEYLVEHPGHTEMLVKDGALAYSKAMLGRVRYKFSENNLVIDGEQLLEEASEEIYNWNIDLEDRFTEDEDWLATSENASKQVEKWIDNPLKED